MRSDRWAGTSFGALLLLLQCPGAPGLVPHRGGVPRDATAGSRRAAASAAAAAAAATATATTAAAPEELEAFRWYREGLPPVQREALEGGGRSAPAARDDDGDGDGGVDARVDARAVLWSLFGTDPRTRGVAEVGSARIARRVVARERDWSGGGGRFGAHRSTSRCERERDWANGGCDSRFVVVASILLLVARRR